MTDKRKKESKYYYESDFGCALCEASNIRQARSRLLREVGTDNNLRNVRLATKNDIAWV